MGSIWGNSLKISIFGESHGAEIGVIIDGFPAGFSVDFNKIEMEMKRRAPSESGSSTKRREKDEALVMSGIYEGKTTGAPIGIRISNTDTKSADYRNLMTIPRPGHADYPAYLRYRGGNDVRGGGHFSGRLTAPIVYAGALCKQLLEQKNIRIGSHILRIGTAQDTSLDPLTIDESQLNEMLQKQLPVIDDKAVESMKNEIESARLSCDSIGGIIECAATGVKAGLGDPMFRGIEQRLSSILFSVPAVKGVEFGDGFALAGMRGSQANDEYRMQNGRVITTSNHNGGILGGISNGAPILFRVAIKPTSSISTKQRSVDLTTMSDTELIVKGRHDACIVPRAVPVIEAVCAIALADLMLEANGYDDDRTASR